MMPPTQGRWPTIETGLTVRLLLQNWHIIYPAYHHDELIGLYLQDKTIFSLGEWNRAAKNNPEKKLDKISPSPPARKKSEKR